MRIAALLVAAALCLVHTLTSLEVRTAITDFLPRDERSHLLELARELSSAPQSRVMVLTVSAQQGAEHRQAAQELRAALAKSGHFEWVRGGFQRTEQEQLYKAFFPARLGLAELPPGAGSVPDAWIEARVRGLRERLTSPLGMLERRLAPEDPLGFFTALLQKQGSGRGRLVLDGDQLVTEDGRWSVLFAATRAPAFDSAAQTKVVQSLEAAVATLRKQVPSLVCEWSGVNRFALDGERSVRGDIERISTLSLLGIFLLYFVVFRSLREPLVVLVPITLGCLFAISVCQLAFGFVHGLTLAFGSSIIGVAEDFSTHYFSHRIATPRQEDNESLMKRLWPGMLMGGITTIAGIAALIVSGFPGLEQMAVFGAVGVAGALISTRVLVPPLSRKGGAPGRGKLSSLGERLVGALSIRPVHALWFVVPALALGAVGLPTVAWSDGLSALRTPSAALDAENLRVQQRLGRGAGGRLVVALAKTDEEALQRAEQGRALLFEAKQKGLVQEYRSVADLLPSEAQQRATRERLRSDATFIPRVRASLQANGFVPEAFAAFEAELLRKDPVLLAPEALKGTPLADLIAPFRAELPSGVAYLTQVSSEHGSELARLFEGKAGLYYVDQEALFNGAYARFRSRASLLIGAGLVLVFVTLFVRYRSFSMVALGMLPALLGAAAALGTQGLLGVPATLMHVIAVLLVLSMGVDYGIYMLESRESLHEGVVTLGSVLLAALTTVLSFGLLGLSSNPALAGIGLTVSLGLLFTVLVSPVVIVGTQRRSG